MKVFAMHYWKEVTRGLVKIQDLVDLAEPLLRGLLVSTSARQRHSEDMELHAEEE